MSLKATGPMSLNLLQLQTPCEETEHLIHMEEFDAKLQDLYEFCKENNIDMVAAFGELVEGEPRTQRVSISTRNDHALLDIIRDITHCWSEYAHKK